MPPGSDVSSVFVGRDLELARLAAALPKVRFALLVGLAGVGKTALVARFARTWDGPVIHRVVLSSQAGAELLDELRRALSTRTPNLVSDDERVHDLARLLDRDATLLVLEDADRLDGNGKALLAELIGQLEAARVIATARTHVFPIGEGPERLQLVLEGLDRAAALELWGQLDLLYGERAGFDEAWQGSRGNPFYLRRAHAGDRGADPLLSDTIAGLTGDPRALAIALVVSELPLAADVAVRVLPDERSAVALDHLRGCLVVESIGRGQVVVHDLIRSALLGAATPAELHDAHRRLAAALAHAIVDPVIGTRERVRHLLRSGQRAPARALVLGRAAELIRLGGSGELIRCLDALTSEDDTEIRLARARVLARMLDLRRAFEDLQYLDANRATASDRVRASLAHLAMLTARFDLAERLSRTALLTAGLEPTLQVRHAAVWLFTRTIQGHGEAGRAWIAELARRVDDRVSRGLFAFMRAFSCWLEELDAEAEEAMRTAWVVLEHEQSVRARLLGPPFWVTVLARAGKTEEAGAALATAEATLEHFKDPLIESSLRALRATMLDSRGDFAAALGELAQVERRWAHGGHVMGQLWARVQRGKLLLQLGRVREGHLLLDDLAREAAAVGAGLIVRQVERTRHAAPRRGVRDEHRARPTRPGELRRDRVVAVLRALAGGHVALARGHLAALDDDATLDPFERALLALGRAVLARGEADLGADAMLTGAVELASRAGADPELIVELDGWLRDAPARTSIAIVIDRNDHVVRVAGEVALELGSRPTLRSLLYALAGEPGKALDKASLATALWPGKYRAERHDSALWVNLKRLRDRLAGTGLRLVTEAVGYRIVVEHGYKLVSS